MYVSPEYYLSSHIRDQHRQAAAHNRAARLRAVRRLERRAQVAARRAQLARLAIQ